MINKDDMADLGVSKKDCVDIVSDDGEMKHVVVYPHNLPPGNLMAYYLEANALIGLSADPRSQTPAFRSMRVSIERKVVIGVNSFSYKVLHLYIENKQSPLNYSIAFKHDKITHSPHEQGITVNSAPASI